MAQKTKSKKYYINTVVNNYLENYNTKIQIIKGFCLKKIKKYIIIF